MLRPLDVYSQGGSREKAKRCLREAIEVWFESCIERGVLHQALQELGFHTGPPWSPSAGSDVMDPPEADEGDVLGERFDFSIGIPAYQASLYQESRVAA